MSKKSVSLSMQKPAPSARAENWVAKSDGSERTKASHSRFPLSCMPESNPNGPEKPEDGRSVSPVYRAGILKCGCEFVNMWKGNYEKM